MAGAAEELNARQRKLVYLHSSIFDSSGPDVQNVYAPERQKAVYESIKGTLGSTNRHHRPDLSLPSAGDIKCTQNAGHGVVLPSNYAIEPRPRTAASGPEVLVYDGEPGSVVRAAARDHDAIPKEFWQTSINLQWHDTRHERCRNKAQAAERQQMGAQELKLQELSSEVFGKARLREASTREPAKELLADSADFLKSDSVLSRSRPSSAPDAGRQQTDAAGARARCQQNLAGSAHNNLPRDACRPAAQAPDQSREEIAVAERRRRQEKNFSDLFGTKMGERRELRDREEVTGTRSLSFLDSRSEIAARNKGRWRDDQVDDAARRKEAEGQSHLFERPSVDKPVVPEHVAEVLRNERGAWDSKGCMQSSSEIARRQRQKDHTKDFDDANGHTHASRRQADMASTQVRLNLGVPEGPKFQPVAVQKLGPPVDSPKKGPSPMEREELLRSAKDTKLASLQSSIFS